MLDGIGYLTEPNRFGNIAFRYQGKLSILFHGISREGVGQVAIGEIQSAFRIFVDTIFKNVGTVAP